MPLAVLQSPPSQSPITYTPPVVIVRQVPAAPPAPPAPPPPVVYSPPPPAFSPPVYATAPLPRVTRSDDVLQRVVVDLDVRGGNELLWQGPLRIAPYEVTAVQRSETQPPEQDCDPQRRYGSYQQTSLNIQLQLDGIASADASRIRVTVGWSRPSEARCPTVAGARVVSLSDVILLPAGGTVTLTGDGGLSVRLHRR